MVPEIWCMKDGRIDGKVGAPPKNHDFHCGLFLGKSDFLEYFSEHGVNSFC